MKKNNLLHSWTIKRDNIRIFKRNNKSSVINIKMIEYNKVNVKLSDTQQKKLKTVVKNKTGTNLRISLKMLNGNNLPHELLLTTRQKQN